MMRKFLLALCLALASSPAWAQCNGVFPPNTLCGNLGASPAPPGPFSAGGTITGPGTTVVGDFATWGNTFGTLLADYNLFGGTNTYTGTNIFSRNASSLPTITPFTPLLHTANTDNQSNFTQLDAFGLIPGGHNAIGHIIFNTSRGTAASPTTIGTTVDLSPNVNGSLGDSLGFIGGNGYDGTSWNSISNAGIALRPTEQWSSSAHGSGIMFGVTPTGSISPIYPFFMQGGVGGSINPYLTINQNSVAPEAPVLASALQVVGSTSVSISGDAYAGTSFWVGRRADGTLSGGKSAVGSAELVASFAGEAWDGSAYSAGIAAFEAITLNAQSGTDHSGCGRVRTIVSGSTSVTEAMRVCSGLSVGITTDPGVGSILANVKVLSPIHAGGTGASSTLTLESTTGAGTTDAIIGLTASQVERFRVTTGGLFNIGPAAAPDSLLTINSNAAATAAPPAGTNMHLIGADGTINQFTFDTFGSVGALLSRVAGGTLASKTAPGANAQLFNFGASGWDGSAYGGSSNIIMFAANGFSGSDHSGYMTFRNVPVGSTSAVEAMRLQASGGLSIGTTTDPAVGSLITSNYVITGITSVSGLAVCNTSRKGARSFVNDSNSTTYHATVASGGANNVGVICDGTNWYISGGLLWTLIGAFLCAAIAAGASARREVGSGGRGKSTMLS